MYGFWAGVGATANVRLLMLLPMIGRGAFMMA